MPARPATATRSPRRSSTASEYLLRQVELIEPHVVCTLGNFATKLLRGDPTGITRVHGRAEVRMIGPRAVRLYPLFHPAAALYTPANVEVLRADFARIPELLALGAAAAAAPRARARAAGGGRGGAAGRAGGRAGGRARGLPLRA